MIIEQAAQFYQPRAIRNKFTHQVIVAIGHQRIFDVAALGVGAVSMALAGTFTWRAPDHAHGLDEVRTLLGLVILVQGFETSRYLGAKYGPDERIRTMRWAQWLSSAIYVGFVLLITSYFGNGLPEHGGETGIIDMLAPLGAALAPMIILAALASQLSAAVADMNGAGGMVSEASARRVSVNVGNLLTAAVAIAITWSANIYEIIAYASKAFVLYYALQSALAAFSAWRLGMRGRALLFGAAVFLAAAIVVFAIPAEV